MPFCNGRQVKVYTPDLGTMYSIYKGAELPTEVQWYCMQSYVCWYAMCISLWKQAFMKVKMKKTQTCLSKNVIVKCFESACQ